MMIGNVRCFIAERDYCLPEWITPQLNYRLADAQRQSDSLNRAPMAITTRAKKNAAELDFSLPQCLPDVVRGAHRHRDHGQRGTLLGTRRERSAVQNPQVFEVMGAIPAVDDRSAR